MTYISLALTAIIFIFAVGTYVILKQRYNDALKALKEVIKQTDRSFEILPELIKYIRENGYEEMQMINDFRESKRIYMTKNSSLEKFKAYTLMEKGLNRIYEISKINRALGEDPKFLEIYNKFLILKEKIVFSTEFYNSTAKKYNKIVLGMPYTMVANVLDFKTLAIFEW